MSAGARAPVHVLCVVAFLVFVSSTHALPAPSWTGVLRDAAGNPVTAATVTLHAASGSLEYSAVTSARGVFSFAHINAGNYEITVTASGNTWQAANRLPIKDDDAL